MSQTEGKMTRERIEKWRKDLVDWNEDPSDEFVADVNILCDLALSALAHDASREWVLEEAAAECSHRAFLAHTHDDYGKGREKGLLDAAKYVRVLASRADSAAEEPFNCKMEGKPCDRWCGGNPCLAEHEPAAPLSAGLAPVDKSESVAAAYARGLEDAAKVCDQIIRRERGWQEDNHVAIATEIQNAIRAKIKPAKEGE